MSRADIQSGDSLRTPVPVHPYIAKILASCVVISLVSCASQSGIAPQAKLAQPDALNAGTALSAAEKIDWPNEKWWQAYNDAQLNALVDKAIAGNPNLQAARARVTIAQSYAQVAHGATLPDIKLEESNVRERFTSLEMVPPPYGGGTYWDNKLGASLNYDLDLWGKQKSLWHAAVDESRAAQAEAQQAKLELEAAIVRYYVQLALAYTLEDISADKLAQLQQKVDIAKRKLNTGLGTALALNKQETLLPPARAEDEAINARIAMLKHQLAALIGAGPGDADGIARPQLSLNANAGIGLPENLPANLLGRRPDIVASRWYVEATNEKIKSAKAEFYPNINLSALAGFTAFGFDKFISNDARNIGAGAALSLPIFDGGTRRGRLSVQTSTYDIAVDNYNDMLLRALQDVADQLTALQSSAKQREEITQSLQMAQQTYALEQASYRAGLSAYENVVDAKIALLAQQQADAQLQAAQWDAYAGLMRALGGGFDQTSEMPASQ